MNEESRHFLFGLTVGELGFIFFFIMLLVAFFEISDRDQVLRTVSLERIAEKKTLARLEAALPLGSEANLDSVFADLAKLELTQAELARVAAENSTLEAKVTQLTSAQRQYEKLRDFIVRESGSETLLNEDLEILSDLVESRETVERALNELGIESSDIDEALRGLVASNSDLKGQLQYLRRRGGIDYPPCWPDQAGKPEYTFDIRVFGDSSIRVRRSSGMPARRLNDYESLPNTREITTSRLSIKRFQRLAQPILDLSDSKECRYYVTIGFESAEACRFQLAVEKYFYKYVSQREQSVCIQ